MPQMFPLNWIMLYSYFILLFIFMNIFLFYNFIQKLQSNNKLIKINLNNNFSWKW